MMKGMCRTLDGKSTNERTKQHSHVNNSNKYQWDNKMQEATMVYTLTLGNVHFGKQVIRRQRINASLI